MREQVAALQPVPPSFSGRVVAIVEYMRLRQESCELIVAGLRAHRQQDIDAAEEKRSRARDAARRIR